MRSECHTTHVSTMAKQCAFVLLLLLAVYRNCGANLPDQKSQHDEPKSDSRVLRTTSELENMVALNDGGPLKKLGKALEKSRQGVVNTHGKVNAYLENAKVKKWITDYYGLPFVRARIPLYYMEELDVNPIWVEQYGKFLRRRTHTLELLVSRGTPEKTIVDPSRLSQLLEQENYNQLVADLIPLGSVKGIDPAGKYQEFLKQELTLVGFLESARIKDGRHEIAPGKEDITLHPIKNLYVQLVNFGSLTELKPPFFLPKSTKRDSLLTENHSS
ncbi:hypothetical protein PsorP6_012744 [Peronosclerospora sorghi]|uniref:Uncharacterized protein n=1 Tax=Peronosclerospora sorghi TaxID=230839 RepID=A0ACC0WGZ9_9STRA|nr:hypothetical protein PsorP6_012744 [Peronosclerospora sorghi]